VKESPPRSSRLGPLKSRKEPDCRQEDFHYLEAISELLRTIATLKLPLFDQFIRGQVLADRREVQAYLPCPAEVVPQDFRSNEEGDGASKGAMTVVLQELKFGHDGNLSQLVACFKRIVLNPMDQTK
jgi:hypothetical protein